MITRFSISWKWPSIKLHHILVKAWRYRNGNWLPQHGSVSCGFTTRKQGLTIAVKTYDWGIAASHSCWPPSFSPMRWCIWVHHLANMTQEYYFVCLRFSWLITTLLSFIRLLFPLVGFHYFPNWLKIPLKGIHFDYAECGPITLHSKIVLQMLQQWCVADGRSLCSLKERTLKGVRGWYRHCTVPVKSPIL